MAQTLRQHGLASAGMGSIKLRIGAWVWTLSAKAASSQRHGVDFRSNPVGFTSSQTSQRIKEFKGLTNIIPWTLPSQHY